MITWNAPSALVVVALLAGPVLIHLLARRRAPRVVFPAMPFVPGIRAAAVRLQRPSDALLLLLRLGIVALAVLAVAQPVLVTRSRQAAWATRLVRAVVVDTSSSVDATAAGGLAEQEMRGAFAVRRLASPDPGDGVRRAVDWLRTVPAARHEVVIVSDFQRGALDASDLAAIPRHIGVRLLRAGPPVRRTTTAPVNGWRDGRWMPSLLLDDATRVIWQRQGDAPPPAVTVRAAAGDMAAAERAARAAQSFGVVDGGSVRPIEIVFSGGSAAASAAAATPWIVTAAIALQRQPIAHDGGPLTIGERGGTLTVRTPLAGSSPLAPALVRAVLLAAAPAVADREMETRSIGDDVLTTWQRDPVAAIGAVPPDASDGRLLWALALLLLAVEWIVRRRMATRARPEVHADAA